MELDHFLKMWGQGVKERAMGVKQKIEEKPMYYLPSELAKETVKTGVGIAKGIGQMTTRVGLSLTDVVRTPAMMKGAEGLQADIPLLGKVSSYQKEQQQRVGDIVEGKQPLWKAAIPFVQVPLEVISTASMIKGAANWANSKYNDILAKNVHDAMLNDFKTAVANDFDKLAGPEYADRIRNLDLSKKTSFADIIDNINNEITPGSLKSSSVSSEFGHPFQTLMKNRATTIAESYGDKFKLPDPDTAKMIQNQIVAQLRKGTIQDPIEADKIAKLDLQNKTIYEAWDMIKSNLSPKYLNDKSLIGNFINYITQGVVSYPFK